MADRSVRLPALAMAHTVAALALAAVAPLWTLLLGPLLLGVPHVVADVRYLILDRPRGLSDRQVFAILMPLAAVAALAPVLPSAATPVLLVLGLLSIAGAAAFASVRPAARAAVIALLAAVALPLVAYPEGSLLGLAHAHNGVAVGLWLCLPERKGARRPFPRYLAAAAFLAGAVLISAGAFDRVPSAFGGWSAPVAGFDLAAVGGTLELPALGASRSLMLFAYAQAVHYVIWLRLIPGELSGAESPVSFRRGLGGLRAALGSRGFAIMVALAVAVPLAGIAAPVAARRLYLDLAGAHAWLELAVAAHLGLAWMRKSATRP